MFTKFSYRKVGDIVRRCAELDIEIPFADNTSALAREFVFCGRRLPNRLGSAPMEGADSEPDGSPSSLTFSRYKALARGESAVIWFEAVAVNEESRSSRNQLWLTEDNLPEFRRLCNEVREEGLKTNGFAPLLVIQANHSGRYSSSENPLTAWSNPCLEKNPRYVRGRPATDEELMRIEELQRETARLSRLAGFDAIDVKACHGYLAAELLSARSRPGPYGGDYEGRTRFFKNCIKAAKAEETPEFRVTSRLGIYDGFPYPYGFGASEDESGEPDLREPSRLAGELLADGIDSVCLTMGNPYVTTHVTRPFNSGAYVPDEDPLEGVARICRGVGKIKKDHPGLTILSSGPSFLREFSGYYAAGAVESGLCDGMLFGRMSLACPDFAKDILTRGEPDTKKVCVACGKCGELIRAHLPTGCVVRNPGIYLGYYREYERRRKDGTK